MPAETKGPTDIRNQPADQQLIDQHPELVDPSVRPFITGPNPAAAAPVAAAPAVPAQTPQQLDHTSASRSGRPAVPASSPARPVASSQAVSQAEITRTQPGTGKEQERGEAANKAANPGPAAKPTPAPPAKKR